MIRPNKYNFFGINLEIQLKAISKLQALLPRLIGYMTKRFATFTRFKRYRLIIEFLVTWTFYYCWEPEVSSVDWQLLRCKLAEKAKISINWWRAICCGKVEVFLVSTCVCVSKFWTGKRLDDVSEFLLDLHLMRKYGPLSLACTLD